MSVLVILNMEDTALGIVGEALAEAGHAVDARAAHAGDPLPDGHESHRALLVLGGAQNALDDEGSPWLPQVLALMRGFAGAGKPVLGICLGAQLLARAFGGQNHIGTAPEFAWTGIAPTLDGEADPLFAGLENGFTSFQWHDDTFSLPPGAVHLACSQEVPSQAFRVAPGVYGTQFHFEAGTAVVRDWASVFDEPMDRKCPGWRERLAQEEAIHGAAADAASWQIARNWVAMIGN